MPTRSLSFPRALLASDAEGEVGSKFLSLWRRAQDGALERILSTGLARAKR